VPLITEFYAGPALGFVPNLADSCTTGISISLGPYTENLGSADTCVLDSGAPGASGAGCAVPAPLLRQFHSQALGGDFNLTLAAPGADEHGSVQVEATAPDWLLFDWDAALPGNENPTGIATFGLYGGEPAQIYLRELYN
jgi:hypothetical protein